MSARPRIRAAQPHEASRAWEAAFTDLSWKATDAPYFPFSPPSLQEYEPGFFSKLVLGVDAQLIELEGQIVGHVSCYWEYEPTRWLEAGLVLYRATNRGHGIGRQALVSWVSHLFRTREVARIGLATWSGNPGMIRCAESVGFVVEGKLRRVRYFEGKYYDAVRLGVLREEWSARHAAGEA